MKCTPPFFEKSHLSALDGEGTLFGCEWKVPITPSNTGIIQSENEDISSETIMPGGIIVSSIMMSPFSSLPVKRQMNSLGYAAFAPESAERRARRLTSICMMNKTGKRNKKQPLSRTRSFLEGGVENHRFEADLQVFAPGKEQVQIRVLAHHYYPVIKAGERS